MGVILTCRDQYAPPSSQRRTSAGRSGTKISTSSMPWRTASSIQCASSGWLPTGQSTKGMGLRQMVSSADQSGASRVQEVIKGGRQKAEGRR